MKHKFVMAIVFLLVLTLVISSSMAAKKYEVGESYDFNPEIANAMKLNWFSSGENRAMLSLVLSIQIADDRVMGNGDVLSGFITNTSFVGKATQNTSAMNMYVILGRYDEYFIYILYSPEARQASFFLAENTSGNSVSDMQMELLIAKLCSEYYKNDSSDILNALSEIQKLL